jgi:pimeloyl-ACP methyl ester carboxylesterase
VEDIAPFEVCLSQSLLDDLIHRLEQTRWPDEVVDGGWDYGVPLALMREITNYWLTEFDWRAQEARINSFSNYVVNVEGIPLHFIYEAGREPAALPLVILHGWPSSFIEMLEIIPLLTEPAKYGGDARDAFSVVIPSLPGYGFSAKPTRRGFSYADVADLIVKLMAKLGYERFAAHAHDHGAAVMARICINHSQNVIAYHTTEPGIPAPDWASSSQPLSDAEAEYLNFRTKWQARDDGYASIQSTRPQTLAYGLNDSPAGLAAWIIDKWYNWTWEENQIGTHLPIPRDLLLANVMLYWVTETANSSARAYFESLHDARRIAADVRISVPLGVCLTNQRIERVPREYAARRYSDIRRWAELERGGHFVVGQEPQLVARSLREFFRSFR